MPELYANDIEAIAKAAFEAHTGERWEDQREEGRCFWRDTVPYAVAPRDPAAGIPDVEAAILKAHAAHFAPKVTAKLVSKPTVDAPEPIPVVDEPVKPKPTKFKK